ncbi:MAG: carboxypeptidase regulatory-like domain-containing protein [Acidobacteriia bacterium]|nr:carboxypeptidase regulatory-like domain-containing protein [Terriglobia bacterium]
MDPMTKAFRLFCLVCLTFIVSIPLVSQTTTGRIRGTVRDKTGASVSGATVTVTDAQRATTRTTTTDETGGYVVPNLAPGVYRVSARAQGFNNVERPNIEVEVATDLTVDFDLPPGSVKETVVVTGDVPLINTTSSTLGGTLSTKEINDLPLNGRNYENLLQLRPGVMRYPGGGFSTTSANGLRAEDNAYLVDGLFNSEPFSGQSIINGAGIAGDSATILPVDAIQQFNLQQNPPAEYGWKPGAIVNVAVKSGTNDIHGTAYAFGRDTPLDARNFFNPVGQDKNPRNLEQFGGTAGGAIVKDKLFYFGGYEGQRYTVGNTGSLQTWSTVPLPTVPLGQPGNCEFTGIGDCANSIPDAIANVHAAFLADAIPNDVSAASLKIAGCTFTPPATVACNGTGFPLNPSTVPGSSINFGLPNTVNTDNAVGKVDFRPNERNTLSSIYFFGNNSGTVSDAGQLQTKWLTQIHTRAQVFGENWTYIPNEHWVNEGRFGYNRLYQPTFTNDHNANLASAYGLNTGVTNPLFGGLPRINVFPFYIFPQELGGFNWPKVQGPDTRVQLIDHISYIVGKHTLKFGGEMHRDSFSGGAYGGSRGRVKFVGGAAFASGNSSGIEDFFAGAPTSGTLLVGDPTRHIHNWGYAGFIQDDWRVSTRLTLNLGLRYELNTVIKEDHDLLGNFDPAAGLIQAGKNGVGGPYNPDRKNFAPRGGFAWDVTGNGRTVLRGGGGITYETVNWESFLALNNSLGLATVPTGAQINSSGGTPGGNISTGVVGFSGSSLNWFGTVFPGNGSINCDPATGAPCTIMGIDRNIKTPYVSNWALNVQHSFTPNLVLEVGYVGNHGSRLVGIRDINQVNPGDPNEIAAQAAGCPVANVCEQVGRPLNTKFPYLGQVFQMGNIYRSNYNALQVTLTSRNYHGLSMVAGYTWAHALDQVGANWDFGAGLGLPSDSAQPNREYASSDFDIRHRFTLSLTYLLPGRKSFAQMLEGWQVNSIISLSGAQPFGVMDAGTDVSRSGELNDRWDFFGNPKDFKSTPTGIPFFPGSGDPNNPTSNASCNSQAVKLDGGVAGGPTSTELSTFGCYANGKSFMIPPTPGTFGTMGRNIFRDTGFRNVDFSVAKNWKLGDHLSAQFRAEFFNIFNHPNFANPFGGQNGFAHNDPSTGSFGCGCATPDVAAANPVIGSGGSRATQLGLKFTF